MDHISFLSEDFPRDDLPMCYQFRYPEYQTDIPTTLLFQAATDRLIVSQVNSLKCANGVIEEKTLNELFAFMFPDPTEQVTFHLESPPYISKSKYLFHG